MLILILTYGAAIWIFIQRPGGRLKLHKTFCVRKTLNTKTNCLLTYFNKGSHGWMCHGWVCIFVFFLSNFKKEKYRIKWGVSVSGMTYVREVLRSFVMMCVCVCGGGGGGWGVAGGWGLKKKAVFAWRTYRTSLGDYFWTESFVIAFVIFKFFGNKKWYEDKS